MIIKYGSANYLKYIIENSDKEWDREMSTYMLCKHDMKSHKQVEYLKHLLLSDESYKVKVRVFDYFVKNYKKELYEVIDYIPARELEIIYNNRGITRDEINLFTSNLLRILFREWDTNDEEQANEIIRSLIKKELEKQ